MHASLFKFGVCRIRISSRCVCLVQFIILTLNLIRKLYNSFLHMYIMLAQLDKIKPSDRRRLLSYVGD